MKIGYRLLAALMALSVIATAVLLVLMPDTVPAHYNFAGEVDRWGSKYEHLLWPALTLLMGAIFYAVAKRCARKTERVNQKIMLYTANATLACFLALGVFFMVKSARPEDTAAPGEIVPQFAKIVCIGLGALLTVLGNLMPKARRNALFGLRTAWSLANDDTWRQSQRVGGIASVAAGLLLIVLGVLLPGSACLVAAAITFIGWLAFCMAASYRIFQKDRKRRQSP